MFDHHSVSVFGFLLLSGGVRSLVLVLNIKRGTLGRLFALATVGIDKEPARFQGSFTHCVTSGNKEQNSAERPSNIKTENPGQGLSFYFGDAATKYLFLSTKK